MQRVPLRIECLVCDLSYNAVFPQAQKNLPNIILHTVTRALRFAQRHPRAAGSIAAAATSSTSIECPRWWTADNDIEDADCEIALSAKPSVVRASMDLSRDLDDASARDACRDSGFPAGDDEAILSMGTL